jgi:hypothetical protein
MNLNPADQIRYGKLPMDTFSPRAVDSPCLQVDRPACRVGDWVTAASVPEWPASQPLQTYRIPARLVSPADTSSPLLDVPLIAWIFRLECRLDQHGTAAPVWVRRA